MVHGGGGDAGADGLAYSFLPNIDARVLSDLQDPRSTIVIQLRHVDGQVSRTAS